MVMILFAKLRVPLFIFMNMHFFTYTRFYRFCIFKKKCCYDFIFWNIVTKFTGYMGHWMTMNPWKNQTDEINGFNFIRKIEGSIYEQVGRFRFDFQTTVIQLLFCIFSLNVLHCNIYIFVHKMNHLFTDYISFPQQDLPGQFDYRCRFSMSGGACTLSVFDLREAQDICDMDEECHGFIWTRKHTWTGGLLIGNRLFWLLNETDKQYASTENSSSKIEVPQFLYCDYVRMYTLT